MNKLGRLSVGVLGLALASIAMADDMQFGVVDMHKVFDAAPEVKQINSRLTDEFSGRRDKVVKLGQALQSDVKKLQKDQAVMSSKDATVLKNQIMKEQGEFRAAQTQFQQDLYAAQNKAMAKFMEKLQVAVKKVAEKQHLSLVLPQNAVLYSASNLDLTSAVISNLK
ncbi:MAG: hypothetical protein A3J38_01110 [Gammaproteobacteria bacterium RIFCSPHIGHO2_12_FULL_45_9]|nr:MAG: hypothetical protein A3J38_01110 [Gammaproteobacteria bacterium RIFCSPHIGHO2_12_FULL_45_9]